MSPPSASMLFATGRLLELTHTCSTSTTPLLVGQSDQHYMVLVSIMDGHDACLGMLFTRLEHHIYASYNFLQIFRTLQQLGSFPRGRDLWRLWAWHKFLRHVKDTKHFSYFSRVPQVFIFRVIRQVLFKEYHGYHCNP